MQQLTVELTVESLVTKFNLQTHPEGGFYAETYRGDTTVEASYGTRSSSTAIYFLITPALSLVYIALQLMKFGISIWVVL